MVLPNKGAFESSALSAETQGGCNSLFQKRVNAEGREIRANIQANRSKQQQAPRFGITERFGLGGIFIPFQALPWAGTP